ncbi:adenylosuccinate lyase [Fusarium mexicanum]|uniref:Adenylosuccinate lyase n=1 Tax=Fusarium mexicanum TaxID=751941 RepID=A0A8H5J1A4_9HYPO|nr:adenylosuccinate lyase [Fusarium mexicanum]
MQFSILAAIVAATIGKYSDAVRSEIPATRSFFYVGGRYDSDGDGGHVFRDQMYVEKLAPVKGAWKDTPIVMIHGMAQTGTNFLNKPDGGVGWASRFIEQGYEVYIVDQTFRGRSAWMPGQGAAKLSTLSAEAVEVAFTDSRTHMLWPQAVNHTQWPGSGVRGDPVFDAFYSSNVEFVDNTTYQQTSVQAAGAALLDRIGKPAVLLGHSQGSFMPTLIADMRPNLTKSIVLLEAAGPPFKDEIFKFGGEFPRPWGLWDVPITYDPPVEDPKKDLVQKVHAQKDDLSTECILQADEPSPRKLVNLMDIPILIVTVKYQLFSRSIKSLSNHASHPVSLSPLSTISLVKMSNAGSSSTAITRARNRPCEMEKLFSRESRYTVWRKLWLWLAESQKQLGIVYRVPIPDTKPQRFTVERIIDDEGLEQLRRCSQVLSYQVHTAQMRSLMGNFLCDLRAQYHYVTDIDAPRSEHWLNIGVTHEYTLENTEQILMAQALDILNTKISMLLYRLRNFAMDHRSAQCVMYKPDSDRPIYVTTIGGRVASWAKALGEILCAFQRLRCSIRSAGSQPITQCEQGNIDYYDKLSMLEHFEGDESKCEKLDELLCQRMGLEKCHADYFTYRSETNGLLGRFCHALGEIALDAVEHLDHFHSSEQMFEKRARNDGSPVTGDDPLHRQSPLLRIAAETLMQAALTFKDPQVPKTLGYGEYIMARLFKHAARVVRVLQSIVEGLFYDAVKANALKWLEMPYMMRAPLIARYNLRGEDRMT